MPLEQPTKEEIRTIWYGPPERRRIFTEIHAEREQQDKTHGNGEVQKLSVQEWLCILTEEVGEACQAANDVYFSHKAGKVTDSAYLFKLAATYRAELVQVAAVAVAAIEHLDERLSKI